MASIIARSARMLIGRLVERPGECVVPQSEDPHLCVRGAVYCTDTDWYRGLLLVACSYTCIFDPALSQRDRI
ncbi:hypothetical protein AWB99_07165 [Mycolicibacterium confluentis]|nr:hypothetical protein AWB99_07165 [Mycolicibacterium confluentis]